jgi:hypothetical protein
MLSRLNKGNPTDRERINFEVDLVGKMMETREEKGDTIDNTICRNLQDVTRS